MSKATTMSIPQSGRPIAETELRHRMNDALAEAVMGWRAKAARYYTGPNEYRPKHRFDPMGELTAAWQLWEAAGAFEGKLTVETDHTGTMTFSATVRCRAGDGRAVAPAAAQAMAEAVANAYGIDSTEVAR